MDQSIEQTVEGPIYIKNQTPLPQIGDIIQGYQIETLIRDTSCSCVFIASDLNDEDDNDNDSNNNGKKALKFIKRKKDISTRLTNELTIMKKLNKLKHPRILPLERYFSYKEYICIVTPFAPFQSLQAVIDVDYPDGIPESTASIIMSQMLEAVQVLHQNQIYHRDIKPDNFLVFNKNNEYPNIVLCDFGFAKEFTDDEKENQYLGTPDYMAPEIIKCKGYNYSVDIWSLGISLFMMLTGRLPLPRYKKGRIFWENALKLANLNYGILEDKNISEEATALIQSLCKKKAEERISIEKALSCKWIDSCAKQTKEETAVFKALLTGSNVTFNTGI